MNVFLVSALLLFYSVAIAQQAPYQAFEVDSAAEPRGGMAYLTTFVQANLRKPIAAEAKGIGGLVVIGGTVEPDGRIANVNVMRSLRPDCDREAVRVFSLFNAWKPARKGNKAVRQLVSIPIRFAANAPFTYIDGKQILYLDADLDFLADSTKRVKFKQVSPVDTNGLFTGDLVVYKFVNNQWEEYARDSLVRRPYGTKDITGKLIFINSHQGAIKGLNGCRYTVSYKGEIVSEECYKKGNSIGPQFYYHPNGVLERRNERIGERFVSSLWYANGQIQQIQEITGTLPDPLVMRVSAVWDSTGQQLVKGGNGLIRNVTTAKSRNDKSGDVLVREQGMYKEYLKSGVWTGHSIDNTYSYEERYENGILLTGKSHTLGHDTITYNLEDRLPTFLGGRQGLASFLASNLHYPEDAQRAGVQGQVLVSFAVCTDGTLCDYSVLRSVSPAIDKEALRVVQRSSGKWQPAVKNGEKVKVKFVLPINFSFR